MLIPSMPPVLGSMRILVCGGRFFKDEARMRAVLCEYSTDTTLIVGADPERFAAMIHGHETLKGADYLALKFAIDAGWAEPQTYAADWPKFGTAAGPIRNRRMIDHGKPDLVIAFPGGRGTADMIYRAEKVGIQVRRVP